MAVPMFMPEVVDQHSANAASIWLIRDHAVRSSSYRLAELVRFDERIEADIDGLRVAGESGWTVWLNELDEGDAGNFFVAGIVALESGDPGRFKQIIDRAYARATDNAGEGYHRAYDPWRGLVSALAWVNRAYAAGAIEWLFDTPRPRTRWLGVAACGARRMVRQPGLEAVVADRESLVRARAARTVGELGRVDLLGPLNALLADQDEDCRFWAAWSSTLLSTTENSLRALAEFARSPGTWNNRALELLLRCLSIDQATAFLRPLATDPARLGTLIRAAGIIGVARYVPWLLAQASEATVARAVGDAFETITGADMSVLDRAPLSDYRLLPNDDPDDGNVEFPPDEGLVWPDAEKLRLWWKDNEARYSAGTAYFLGVEKSSTDWLSVLAEAPQRQRWTGALELALHNRGKAMFEVRARGDLQGQLLSRAHQAR